MPQYLPDYTLQKKLIKVALVLLLLVFAIAFATFAGWLFSADRLKSFQSGVVVMNPLTSVLFVGLVFSAYVKIKLPVQQMLNWACYVIDVAIFVIACWKLSSVIYATPFSLDVMFFQSPVLGSNITGPIDSMAPVTAFSFILASINCLLIRFANGRMILVAQTLAVVLMLTAFFCLLGYLFGAIEFYEKKNSAPIALRTALCFFMYSIAMLFANPFAGFMQQFTSAHSGSYVAWRLILPAFLLPLIVGFVRLRGQRAGLYNLEFGSALFVTSMVLVFLTLIWLITYMLNVREEKQRETLAEKQHLANLVEQTSDAILSTDTAFNIKSWNKGAEEMYGYTKEEVLNKPLGAFLKATLPPEQTQKLLEALLENGYYTTEYEFIAKQHQPILIQASVTVLKNASNEVTGYVAVHRDISLAKKMEQQLRQFNSQLEIQVQQKTQELRDVFERISEAVLGIDNNGNIIYANGKGEELFSTNLVQLVNKSIFQVFQQKDGEIESALQEALSAREYIYLETLLPEFSKWFELHIYPSTSGISVYLKDITVRKKALLELHASEEKYRLFFENSMDGILITNADGQIFGANAAACAIFGLTEEEICSIGRKGILDESDPNWTLFWDERRRNGKAQGELKHVRKDGSVFLAETTSVIFKTASGEEKANTIIRDITEKRKAQEALFKSEEKYRNLVEQAGDGILLFSSEGAVLDANESMMALLNYSKQELVTFKVDEIFINETNASDMARFDKLSAGDSIVIQRALKRKNGDFLQTEIRAKRLHDGVCLAIVRDLTDRIKAQQQLQKEKDLLHSIINSVPGIFYLFNKNGKFLSWNKQFEKVSEYNAEEIAKMIPLDFFNEGERLYMEKRISDVFKDGSSDAEAYFISKSGKQNPYFFTGARIIVDEEICVVGMGIDITDRKRFELEIKESYEQIRRLTNYLQNIREEERANIAREIHDELGQQLTVIKMDVSWLRKKMNTGDTVAVNEKVDEMLEILDSTVASVRRIATELRPSLLDDIGLIAAIEWQIEVFSKRTGIQVNLLKSTETLIVPDDCATGLFRILQESLTNITRYANANQVDIHLKNQNKEFILCIKDNGDGFDVNHLAGKKTLGLLGMRERSIAMHGTFTLQSMPGQGTIVEVSVPLTE